MSKYETLSGVPTRGGACHPWHGAATVKGYGCRTFEGRTRLAHRVAYQLHTGIDPTGKVVLHTCDNPICVNPDHLFLGAQGDNVQDMIAKGRDSFGGKRPQFGSKNGMATLCEEEVIEIKLLLDEGHYQKDIAEWFGVSRQAITNISTGHRWSHI